MSTGIGSFPTGSGTSIGASGALPPSTYSYTTSGGLTASGTSTYSWISVTDPTIYVYPEATGAGGFALADSLTLATQGALDWATPLTVGVQGVLEPLLVPVPPGTDITMGGTATVEADITYDSSGIIIISGETLVAITKDYVSTGPIIIGGDTLTTATRNYDSSGNIIIGGETLTTATRTYDSNGNLITGGDTTVIFTAGEGTGRGGKGTPARKPVHRRPIRHTYVYSSEAFFENTITVGGRSLVSFVPGKYQFIKTLPKVPKTEPVGDSEFIKLYKDVQQAKPVTVYSYEPDGIIKFGGKSKQEFFDFGNFIITHDDDVIISDILSSTENPFLTTKYDITLESRRRDDDSLLEILELL
jgi:hypothetical protein